MKTSSIKKLFNKKIKYLSDLISLDCFSKYNDARDNALYFGLRLGANMCKLGSENEYTLDASLSSNCFLWTHNQKHYCKY